MDREIISWLLICAGMPFLIGTVRYARYADQRLRARGYLCGAIGHGLLCLGSALVEYHLAASLNAAFTAWHLYNWWNNGGGDGLRRLLKKIRTFGAGRLAPQPS